MPGFDGTGPRGNGPRTGRGLGRCRNSVYCDHCPFNSSQESLKTLEEKELFLIKMLAEIKAEKARHETKKS